MNYSIAVLPGDGIGPEVLAEGAKGLEAVGARYGHQFQMSYAPVGGNAPPRALGRQTSRHLDAGAGLGAVSASAGCVG